MAAWMSSRVGCLDACEQRRRADDLTRRAVAALQCVLGDERLLERGRAVQRQALDRRHGVPFGRRGEHEARGDGATVHQDGAGATRPLGTADLRARQPEIVAQHVGEPPCGGDLELIALPVDVERDPHARRTTREQSCSRCS